MCTETKGVALKSTQFRYPASGYLKSLRSFQGEDTNTNGVRGDCSTSYHECCTVRECLPTCAYIISADRMKQRFANFELTYG